MIKSVISIKSNRDSLAHYHIKPFTIFTCYLSRVEFHKSKDIFYFTERSDEDKRSSPKDLNNYYDDRRAPRCRDCFVISTDKDRSLE